MRPILKRRTTMTTKLTTGAPSHNGSDSDSASISPSPSPESEQEASTSSNNYEDSRRTPGHSEDDHDTESGYEEPNRNKRPVPQRRGLAPHQKNDTGGIDDDEDVDMLATEPPLNDIPEAVLQDTLAALQRFTLECNRIAQKHGVSPSVPRWVLLNAESLGLNKRCGNSFNAYQQTEMVKRGWHKSKTEGQRLTPGTLLLF
jgi:flagellum-specific peptidoglycan hydrolase FlgJ